MAGESNKPRKKWVPKGTNSQIQIFSDIKFKDLTPTTD